MKFTVSKLDLKRALDVVSPAMASTGSDLSSHYLFRRPLNGSMDRVEVLTQSGRMAARSRFVGTIERTADTDDHDLWAFTLEGWRLDMWLNSKSDDKFLSFTYDHSTKNVTVAVLGQTKLHPAEMGSLDPTLWPYWDETLQEATENGIIPGPQLIQALKFSKTFASVEENRIPEYCLCEARDGALASSDKKGASLVYNAGMVKSTIRLHVRDVPGVVAFIDKMVGPNISILEHARSVFFQCGEDIFVESRSQYVFPKFKHPEKTDQRWWVLNVDEITQGIPHMLAFAESKNDPRLTFRRPDPDGPVYVSMRGIAADKPCVVELDVVESGSTPGALELPDEGFMIDRNRLTDYLSMHRDKTVKFGLNSKPGSTGAGYVRFHAVQFADDKGQNGDEYVTILSWLKK